MTRVDGDNSRISSKTFGKTILSQKNTQQQIETKKQKETKHANKKVKIKKEKIENEKIETETAHDVVR